MGQNELNVTIGNTECDIKQILTSQINCLIKNSSAGNFPVIIKSLYGISNSDIRFTYSIQIQSLSKNEGIYIILYYIIILIKS